MFLQRSYSIYSRMAVVFVPVGLWRPPAVTQVSARLKRNVELDAVGKSVSVVFIGVFFYIYIIYIYI